MMEEEGSPMGPYLRFANAIADAVREEFPGKAVDTLAYQFTRKPPSGTAPRPNVIVRLCSIECCFSHPLSAPAHVDPRNAEFASDLDGWSKLSERLYVWDYVINYAHSIMPFPNLYTLRPNIRFFVDHGVQGIYEEANYFSKGGELAELRTWILAKTLWDPGYSTDQAIDEFLEAYYEEAAPPLRRYIDLIHGKARMAGRHFRIYDGPESPFFSAELVDSAAALLAEAETAAAAKPAVLHRVQVAALPISYVRMARRLERIRSGGAAVEDRKILKELLEKFATVAAKEGISHISEGKRYTSWAEEVEKALGTEPR
jgi:hypothetical protein